MGIRNSCPSVYRGRFGSGFMQLSELGVFAHGGLLEVWHASRRVERVERLRNEGKAAINYRHIIYSLVNMNITMKLR